MREEPVISGGPQRLHEGLDRKIALAREAAVVAAPREVIHLELRCVGDLDEEDAILRDRSHRAEIGLADEGMKRVEHETDRWVVGSADHFPGVPVVVDVAPPGERLIPDAQPPRRSALAELMEVSCRAVDAAERVLRDVAADEEEVAPELLHHVELALGA